MKSWIQAARPKTLSAALVPIVISWGVVESTGAKPLLWTFIAALLSSIFIQVGTNFVNDASDFKSGKDTAARLGPTRVTASGMLTYRSVMNMAGICFFLAFAFGVPLIIKGGVPILILGMASIAAGYAYTSGPYPLAYNGLGEIFVIFFFGFCAVLGLCHINLNYVPYHALIAGAQAGLLCSVLLAINNYRDIGEDRQTGKKTLAARFGKTFAKYEIGFLLLFPFALGVLYNFVGHGYKLAFSLPLGATPLAWKIFSYVRSNDPSQKLNMYLGLSSLLYMVFGLLLTVGLALG